MTELQSLGYGRADAQLLVELLQLPEAQIDAASLKATFGIRPKERHLAFPFMPDDLAIFLLWAIGSPPLRPNILRLANMLRADPERAEHPLAEALQRVADQVGELEARFLYPDSFQAEIDAAYAELANAGAVAVRKPPRNRLSNDDDTAAAHHHLLHLREEQHSELDDWLVMLQRELEAASSPMPGFPEGSYDIFEAAKDSDIGAGLIAQPSASDLKVAGHPPKRRRRREDVLTPIIRRALESSKGGNWASIFEILSRFAELKIAPLRGVSREGIEYSDGLSPGNRVITAAALRQRVLRMQSPET